MKLVDYMRLRLCVWWCQNSCFWKNQNESIIIIIMYTSFAQLNLIMTTIDVIYVI